jgi:hypothetical protein
MHTDQRVRVMIIHPELNSADVRYASVNSPADVFGHTRFTVCGACIEKSLVLVRQSDDYFDEHESERKVVCPKAFAALYGNEFVHDELIGHIVVLQTDQHGNLIDYS